MLVDVRVHSASAALHWQLGSGQCGSGSATVHGTQSSDSLSALDSASAHVTAEP